MSFRSFFSLYTGMLGAGIGIVATEDDANLQLNATVGAVLGWLAGRAVAIAIENHGNE